MQNLKELIKAEAAKLGFCLCGFTSAAPLSDYDRYLRWLESEPLGTMAYLKRPDTLAKRADPHLLLPDVESICILAVPMGLQKTETIPEVASYAHYTDYHDTILPMAKEMGIVVCPENIYISSVLPFPTHNIGWLDIAMDNRR